MENVQPSMLLSNLSIDFCQPIVSVSTIKVQLYSIVYRLKEINNQKSKTKIEKNMDLKTNNLA